MKNIVQIQPIDYETFFKLLMIDCDLGKRGSKVSRFAAHKCKLIDKK